MCSELCLLPITFRGRTTVGRTPLDEWSARRRDLYLTTHNTQQHSNFHAYGKFLTHSTSKREAVNLPLYCVATGSGVHVLETQKPKVTVKCSLGHGHKTNTRTIPFKTWPDKLLNTRHRRGTPGSAVVWGTALQVGRSQVRFPMVSSEFFVDIILPAALRPWGWLSL
jgi:hypothetical protein